MPLSKPLKTQEKSLGPILPAIPAAGKGKGRLMTTFSGPPSGCFKQNQYVAPIGTAGNDDFRTTLGRPDDDPMTTR